jgi:ankyrin repeat protein
VAEPYGDYPPLHFAIAHNAKPEIVKLLLERGASPNSTCPDGSVMHLAVCHTESWVVKMLLAKGADVNGGVAAPAVTPLHLAIMLHPHGPNIANMLVENGAKIDVFSAAGLGKIDVLKKLIKDNPKAVTDANEGGLAPLQYAAAGGQIEAAKLLLDSKADPSAGAKDGEKHHPFCLSTNTPLHLAVSFEHADMASLLLAHKANIEARNCFGQTPIFFAEDAKFVNLLLKAGANIEAVNSYGQTPLLSAASSWDRERVEVLLAAKADPNVPVAPGASNHVTFYSGTSSGRPPNPNGVTTALHVAASQGNCKMIAALIKAGANVSVQDTDGMGPLDVAVELDRKEAVKVLRDSGAKESPKSDTPPSDDGSGT